MFLGKQAQNLKYISVNQNILFQHVNNHFNNVAFVHSGLWIQEM